MNLLLNSACTADSEGVIHFDWRLDTVDGIRIAEQIGHLVNCPPDVQSPPVVAEAILAALEWLQPYQYERLRSLHVVASAAVRDSLDRPFAEGDESTLACVAAYLALFRRKGVLVAVGPEEPVIRRELPQPWPDEVQPSPAPKKAPRPHSQLHDTIRQALLREPPASSDTHIADVANCHRTPVLKVRYRMTEAGELTGGASFWAPHRKYKESDYQKWVTGKGKRPVR